MTAAQPRSRCRVFPVRFGTSDPNEGLPRAGNLGLDIPIY